MYDDEGGSFTIDVEDGLYAVNLETLAETKIAEVTDQENVYEEYLFLEDGVFYILHSDYSNNGIDRRILRRNVTGEELPTIELGEKDIFPICVKDGTVWCIETEVVEDEERWFSMDRIVYFDPDTGAKTSLTLEENEVLFYTERMPGLAVANGRVYYFVLNEQTNVESFKSMAADGSDVRTLAHGEPLY